MKFPHLTIHLDWPWKKTLRTAGALSIGKVVALTLEPYTVATIFGTNQDAAFADHVALIELHDKGMTVEKTVTLDGKKDRPYHVAGEHEKFSVTWGPFPEEKKIQIALYWTDTSGNELEPIDAVNELSDDNSQTKVTLLSIHQPDKTTKLALRTVIIITRMKVKG